MVPPVSRAESQAATRAALVEAAESLLREKSYAELTVRAIAARAGYTTGAFFAHFPSKADLVLELVQRSRNQSFDFLIDVTDRAWAEHDDDFVAQQFVARYEAIHDEAVVMLDVLAQGLRDPEFAPGVGALTRQATEMFTQFQVLSSIPPERRREVAAQVFALYQGLLLQSIGQPDLNIAVLFARGARSLIDEHSQQESS